VITAHELALLRAALVALCRRLPHDAETDAARALVWTRMGELDAALGLSVPREPRDGEAEHGR